MTDSSVCLPLPVLGFLLKRCIYAFEPRNRAELASVGGTHPSRYSSSSSESISSRLAICTPVAWNQGNVVFGVFLCLSLCFPALQDRVSQEEFCIRLSVRLMLELLSSQVEFFLLGLAYVTLFFLNGSSTRGLGHTHAPLCHTPRGMAQWQAHSWMAFLFWHD